MNPICGKCHCMMVCKKNEILVRDQATEKFPSTAHYGDLYECPQCKTSVIAGFGGPVETDEPGIVWWQVKEGS